jgi:hypothetical protein
MDHVSARSDRMQVAVFPRISVNARAPIGQGASCRMHGKFWSPDRVREPSRARIPAIGLFHSRDDLMGWDTGASPIAGSQGPLPTPRWTRRFGQPCLRSCSKCGSPVQSCLHCSKGCSSPTVLLRTFPMMACPPSFTWTCSTRTTCEPPFLSRRPVPYRLRKTSLLECGIGGQPAYTVHSL